MAAVERDWLFPEDGKDEDASALLKRLRDAFQCNHPDDWRRASDTLRQIDEEVRHIIDRGDLAALPGACLALGFMISLHDARTGARTIRQQCGAQRGRKIAEKVVAHYKEINGGRIPLRAKRGSVDQTAAHFKISPRRVYAIIRSEEERIRNKVSCSEFSC